MTSRNTILRDRSLLDHFSRYREERKTYLDTALELLGQSNVSKNIPLLNKAKVLTVILQNKESDVFDKLLNKGGIDLPELTKACEFLDTPRYIRQLEKKIAKRKKRAYHLTNKVKLLKQPINGVSHLSLTSSKIKMIRKWVNSLTEKDLVYRALIFPTATWKTLADKCHFNPEKDFVLPWFLPYCYGKEPPMETVINKVKNVSLSNFAEVYEEYDLPYEYVRLKLKEFKSQYYSEKNATIEFIKQRVATKEDLRTVLWYWDELQSELVNIIITSRVKKVDNIDLSFGKLTHLLMSIRHPPLYEEILRLTENRLKSYETSLDGPIVVLGDASSSMQVAINTSSIITTLLCSLTRAQLHLFKSNDIPIKNPPRTTNEAVAFARKMTASQCTSPASSLNYFYTRKEEVKTFIIVTDEEENTSINGRSLWSSYGKKVDQDTMFAGLYHKYAKEIYPARLIFISFTSPQKDGDMVTSLKREIGEKKVAEFVEVYKFNVNDPDLNKLDTVLERMTCHDVVSDNFEIV